jgi:hypothetical protein
MIFFNKENFYSCVFALIESYIEDTNNKAHFEQNIYKNTEIETKTFQTL